MKRFCNTSIKLVKCAIALLTTSALIISCGDKNSYEPNGGSLKDRDYVATGNATKITTGSAIVNCTINLSQLSNIKKFGVIYSTSSNLQINPKYVNFSQAVNSDGQYSILISNLDDNTTYYYSAYAVLPTNDKIMARETKSFTTKERALTSFMDVREAVDLGLSVKWAPRNVGAKLPGDYGDYFVWGFTDIRDVCNEYNSYYETHYQTLLLEEVIDSHGNLTEKNDAATANCGKPWRMPTKEEMEELVNNCTWTWDILDGHNGYKVTGPSGKSIFIPACGQRYERELMGADEAFYWSATAYSNYYSYSYYLHFKNDSYSCGSIARKTGMSVRPVTK